MAKNKWKFAIGTTSRVPESKQHYLIADIDSHDTTNLEHRKIKFLLEELITCRVFWQKTKHGWHLYTNYICSFSELLKLLKGCCDSKWLKIGRERGYLFLADKDIVNLPWAVERMIIHAK